MLRPPRRPDAPIIGLRRGMLMIWQGVVLAAASAVAFFVLYRGVESNLPMARTAAFCTMAFSQLFFSLACRSDTAVMPRLGLLSNRQLLGAIALGGLLQVAFILVPVFRHILKAAPLSITGWLLVIALALTPVTLVEIPKLLRPLWRRFHPLNVIRIAYC